MLSDPILTGTGCTIAAGITTIATGGLAAPLLIGSLMWTGFGVGALGAGLKIGGGIHGAKSKKVLKNLEEAIKEDIEAHQILMRKLELLKGNPDYSENLKFTIAEASVTPAGNGSIAFCSVFGVPGIISILD